MIATDATTLAGDATPIGLAKADTGFLDLLDRSGAALVGTFAPGIVGCFGAHGGELNQVFTHLPGCFGVSHQEGRLAISTRREIGIFTLSRRLAPLYPGLPGQFDGMFLLTGTLTTGPCAIHDLVIDGPDVVFVNTLYSCVARASLSHSFVPLWRPDFISAVLPEDRCHLNSFALDGTQLRYVTAFAASDASRGYRDLPVDRGLLLEVETGRVVLDGLIRPHGARLFHGALHVLNSGKGEVLRVDPITGAAQVLASLPGFTRGCFGLGDALLVGLSKTRDTAIGLNLPVACAQLDAVTIVAIDHTSGAEIGRLKLPPEVTEVLDFTLVPNLRSAVLHPPDSESIPVELPEVSLWTTLTDPA